MPTPRRLVVRGSHFILLLIVVCAGVAAAPLHSRKREKAPDAEFGNPRTTVMSPPSGVAEERASQAITARSDAGDESIIGSPL